MKPSPPLAFLLGALLALARPCVAQNAPLEAPREAPPEAPTAAPPADSPDGEPAEDAAPVPAPMPDMESLVSDSIARLALTTLRDETNPDADSFTRTAIGLRIARRLRPDDLELIRLERDAWRAADNEVEANRLLERIVALDPADTVSVARLLILRMSQLQTADERLAAYDRLLSDSGSALDPSIRSRLALDSALLLRERGEDAAFVERLTLATTLDVTNKDAAALYASYFLPIVTDAKARADLLANVVLSDPTDVSTVTNLAQHLFSVGAYRGTQRLFALAENLIVGSGRSLGAEDLFDRLLVDWMVEGDEAALGPVQDMFNQQQSYLNMQIRQAERLGQPPPELTTAQLPASFETLRLAVAFGRKDAEGAREAALRAADTLMSQIDRLNERTGVFEDWTEEEAAEAIKSTELELAFVRLWGDVQIDEAESTLDAVTGQEDQGGLSPEAVQRFRGLIALRRGDLERAEALLAPLEETDFTARVGLGLVYEQTGREREALASFARVALDRPNSAIGCACRRRIETTLGRPLQPTPAAEVLDQFGLDFAPWLDHFTQSPHNFLSLSARHVSNRLDIFDRDEVRIRVRNISSYPLGVGPERPVNSRFVLTPNVVIEGRIRTPLALPEIINLDHRFRLMPREEMELVVWATRGTVGIALEQNVDRSISLRWRVIQGVRYDDEDRFTTGPMCVSAETGVAFQRNLPEPESIEALAASIAVSTGRSFLEDLLLAAGLSVRRTAGITDTIQTERRAAMGEAIAARVPEMDDLWRTYVVCVGFRAGFLFATPRFDEILASDDGPFVNTALLFTSYRLRDNAGADRLVDHPDPDIAELARLAVRHRERMGAVFSQPVIPERPPEGEEEEIEEETVEPLPE